MNISQRWDRIIVALILVCFSPSFGLLRQQSRGWSTYLRFRPLYMSKSISENAKHQLKSEDWKFLDAIYLITTDKSKSSRLQQTQQALQDCQLSNLVQIRSFPTDDENRVRGCYTSHIKVLKEIQRQFARKTQYQVLILEDNLEMTPNVRREIIQAMESFLTSSPSWDIFHLAYMMYVPGLKLLQLNRHPAILTSSSNEEDNTNNNDISGQSTSQIDYRQFPWSKHIVQMFAEKTAVVGTSAYIISKHGVERLLQHDARYGFTEAIPNIMASLFPTTRFACYPMLFHRAGRTILFL